MGRKSAEMGSLEKKGDESQEVIREMLTSIKALDRRIDSTIGALGPVGEHIKNLTTMEGSY